MIDGDRGKNYPKESDLQKEGFCLFLSAKNITSSGFDPNNASFITREKDELLRAGKIQNGDIVITTRGTIGRFAFFNDKITFQNIRINSGMLIIRADEENWNRRFLYFFMRSKNFLQQIESFTSGSAVPQLPARDFVKLQVPDFSLPKQNKIDKIIGDIHELIEINQNLSGKIGVLISSLFRSWFIDFEPVKAKAEGKLPYGMDEETAALFPNSFEYSELGSIPTGWKVVNYENVCERIFSGGTPNTQESDYWGGDVPWLSSGETRESIINSTERTITQEGVKNSSTRIARKGTTVIASAGQGNTRGQTSILGIDTYINQSIIAVESDSQQISDLFIFQSLKPRYTEMRFLSDANSVRGSMTTRMVKEMKLVLPPVEFVKTFDAICQPIFKLRSAIKNQGKSMSELRDVLLPRLMSGELKVPTEA